jgi:hypothetical protein
LTIANAEIVIAAKRDGRVILAADFETKKQIHMETNQEMTEKNATVSIACFQSTCQSEM